MCDVCKQVKRELKKTRQQIKQLEAGTELIDTDLVKATKAMFYEEVSAIYRKLKTEEDK